MLGLTLIFCSMQVLALAVSLTYQALIPEFTILWGLSNTQAGWIASVSYIAYALTAPVLVTLTDRIDARIIVIACLLVAAVSAAGFAMTADGFWSALGWRGLTGVALAGTYMPGLKALTDRLAEAGRGRYQALYTASFSLGSGFSLWLAGAFSDWFGWRTAFAVSSGCAIAGALLMIFAVAAKSPNRSRTTALFDYRPILKDRSVMRYVFAYAGHSWELFVFRTWLAAFLTAAAVASGEAKSGAEIGLIAMLLVSAGLPASILGNELATRFDRPTTLAATMVLSGLLACAVGFGIGLPFWWIVAAMAGYAILVMADSAAITVGTLSQAPAERRGAVIAVQTMIASLMAMVSPLAAGLSLDMFGADTALGWGVAFLASGLGVVVGGVVLLVFKPTNQERSRHV